MLWSQRKTFPPLPRLRMGIKVGAEAPNISGVGRLVTKGWAGIAGQSGMVYLTNGGLAYCEAHQVEIAAYVPYANLAPRGN